MTIIVGVVLVALLALLVGAVFVVFALLKRLDQANAALKLAADQTMAEAVKMQARAPKQMDQMLASMATMTAQTHASLESLVKTVLTPPPVVYSTAPDGLNYAMPAQEEGGPTGLWDHTDSLMPTTADRVGGLDSGYEHEGEPGFDPENPFGIPGMKSLVP